MLLLITRYNLSSWRIHLLLFLVFYFILIKLHYFDFNYISCMTTDNNEISEAEKTEIACMLSKLEEIQTERRILSESIYNDGLKLKETQAEEQIIIERLKTLNISNNKDYLKKLLKITSPLVLGAAATAVGAPVAGVAGLIGGGAVLLETISAYNQHTVDSLNLETTSSTQIFPQNTINSSNNIMLNPELSLISDVPKPLLIKSKSDTNLFFLGTAAETKSNTANLVAKTQELQNQTEVLQNHLNSVTSGYDRGTKFIKNYLNNIETEATNSINICNERADSLQAQNTEMLEQMATITKQVETLLEQYK